MCLVFGKCPGQVKTDMCLPKSSFSEIHLLGKRASIYVVACAMYGVSKNNVSNVLKNKSEYTNAYECNSSTGRKNICIRQPC